MASLGERLGERVAGQRLHAGFAVALRERRHLLPQFLGDEGNDRVGEAQHGFQHAHQGAAGGALLRSASPIAICTLASSRYQSQYSSQTNS